MNIFSIIQLYIYASISHIHTDKVIIRHQSKPHTSTTLKETAIYYFFCLGIRPKLTSDSPHFASNRVFSPQIRHWRKCHCNTHFNNGFSSIFHIFPKFDVS